MWMIDVFLKRKVELRAPDILSFTGLKLMIQINSDQIQAFPTKTYWIIFSIIKIHDSLHDLL